MIRKPKRYIIKNLIQLKDDRGRYRRSKTRTVRRKKKAVPQSSAAQSDIKLFTALKKLGLTNIPGSKEVDLFKENSKVIYFSNPKVQASITTSTYIISGPSETKPL